MNLILWRHAEAQDAEPDLARELTPRGRKQAEHMARWLRAQLPKRHLVLASPAQRTRQTADALETDYRVERNLAPDVDVAHYLAASVWPEGPEGCGGTVVLVGHQPILGRLASLLLCGEEQNWSVRKGAVWWLTTRDREGRAQVVLRSVINPEQL
ncbi:MAG: histidine phosphatase family protein [Burkholderiaceae bacterium]|nr:histidine phosphatase family protein [Burkholderiaceae bacterium]